MVSSPSYKDTSSAWSGFHPYNVLLPSSHPVTWGLRASTYEFEAFEIYYSLCSWRWRSSIQSAKTRLGADCGSDHELLVAKFRLKLKKVGKTTTTFRYDLNEITYNYTMEVINRVKGLDLIDRVPEEPWRGLWHGTVGGNQYHPQEKEMQKGKVVVWGGLTNSWEKKRREKQRRKGKIYPPECRVPKTTKKR